MKVYSFTGKSGTGKSYQAIRVAKEKGIPALIDDGLLIYKNKIVAGRSAKNVNQEPKRCALHFSIMRITESMCRKR